MYKGTHCAWYICIVYYIIYYVHILNSDTLVLVSTQVINLPLNITKEKLTSCFDTMKHKTFGNNTVLKIMECQR